MWCNPTFDSQIKSERGKISLEVFRNFACLFPFGKHFIPNGIIIVVWKGLAGA